MTVQGAPRQLPVPTPGPLLFARYAYPPNALGYCGGADPDALLGAAAAGDRPDLVDLRHRAADFEGAWPYLELIAWCSHIKDPLDPRVVEAYWIGNSLLDRVPDETLIASLRDRFERRAGTYFESLASSVPAGGVPHHSFHVFAIYPWLGLLKAGMEGAPLTVLDRCRIRWGMVEAVSGDLVVVRSRHLTFVNSRLILGTETFEEVHAGNDGVFLVRDLSVGDHVSLHWDWVCDRITQAQAQALHAFTRRNLAAVNGLSHPGPAAICGV
jgi:hypothetical protein